MFYPQQTRKKVIGLSDCVPIPEITTKYVWKQGEKYSKKIVDCMPIGSIFK